MGEDAESLAERRRLYDLLVATPGLGARELQRAGGLDWGTTALQLLKLEEAGHLTRERGPTMEFYFPAAVRPTDRVTRRLAGSEFARRLLLAVLERPGSTPTQLAALLGVGEGPVGLYLRPLIRNGVLAADGNDATATVRVADRRRLGAIVAVRRGLFDGYADRSAALWGELFPAG